MRSILRDGGIPILRCERSSSGFGTPSLSYVAAHPNIKYTAISHLWSDGLGQPSRNSLPQCQLIRLMNAVNEADAKFKTETNPLYGRLFDVYHEFGSFSRNTSYPKWPARVILEDGWYDRAARRTRTSMIETRDSIHLWLDVYCVPVDNEDLRRKAIARMTPTYSRATHVHVLDHDLQQMEENNNVLDMVAQIAVCGWGTRAWTTQERSLAMGITYGIGCGSNPMVWSSGWHGLWDRIYISNYAQFSEQGFCHYAVSAQIYIDLIDEIQGGQLNPLGITGESTNFFESSPLRFNRGWRFARVWNALRVKNTTKAEDSLGIFANLLGLSAGEILHLSTKDQMKAILASHQFLPIDLLLTITPRYLIDNQTGRQECSLEEQWIPKGPRSEIDLAWSEELEGLETMRVLPEGLLIDSHDLTPDNGTTHAMVGVHVFQPRGDHVALDLDGEGLDGTTTRRRYWVSLQRDGHDCGLSSNVDSLYFVLRVRTGWSQADNPALFRARGACLVPKGMSNGRLCMIYACPVFWGFSIDEVVTENFRFQPSNSVVCSARLHTDGDPGILIGCGESQSPTNWIS
ncbi:MAG: hypothetical protein M1822_002062 [Bathelium mastoideum]|nr:MAG: hypothetical protein M1822_002062 [Bathelium mastoideum]